MNLLHAQDSIQKIKIYETWISLYSEPYNVKGALYEIKYHSIIVSNSTRILDYSTNNFESTMFNIENIEIIKIRRKNRILKGVIIGTITGFALGGVIGLLNGEEEQGTSLYWGPTTTGELTIAFGVPLAVVGAGLGALAGSVKVKIPINGNISNYSRYKHKLRKYSIKKERR